MRKIKVIYGDITKVECDAIVNAANKSLMGGGGVDGAIHKAGGRSIIEECRKIIDIHGECPTGEAVITTAGKLTAKFVIHTVGPIYDPLHNSSSLLKNCYFNSLRIAESKKIKIIAFPNISTGIYGYPKFEAANICINAINEYFNKLSKSSIEKVFIVCFDDENYKLINELIS